MQHRALFLLSPSVKGFPGAAICLKSLPLSHFGICIFLLEIFSKFDALSCLFSSNFASIHNISYVFFWNNIYSRQTKQGCTILQS